MGKVHISAKIIGNNIQVHTKVHQNLHFTSVLDSTEKTGRSAFELLVVSPE